MSYLRIIGFVLLLLFAKGCRSSEDFVKRGDAFAAKGNFGDAAIAYQNAIKKDGKAPLAYRRLADIEAKNGNWMNAYRLLAQASGLSADNADLKVELGNAALAAYAADQRRPDNLRKQIDQILAGLPKDRERDRMRMAGLLAKLDGKVEVAVAEFEKLRQAGPMPPSILINLMTSYLEMEQLQKVEELGLSAIATQPQLIDAYDLLFKVYLTQNRAADAEKLLKQKLANNPKEPSAYLQLIEFYTVSPDRQADLAAITAKFTADRANFPTAWQSVGEVYERLNRPEQAVEAYKSGHKGDQTRAGLYLRSVADLLWRLGRREEAVENAKAAVAAEPKNQEGQRLLASFQLAAGKPEDLERVIQVYSDLLKDRQNDPVINVQLGMAYRAKNDIARANGYFQAALRANPRFPQANLALAELAAQSGNHALASKYLGDILAVDPDNPRIRFLQAGALRNMGLYAESAKITNALLSRDPNNADYQIESGLVSLAAGKNQEALAKFESLKQTIPNDKRVMAGLLKAYTAAGKQDNFRTLATAELQRDPKNTFLLEAVAENALRLKDYKGAAANYTQLLQVDPNHRNAAFHLGLLAMREEKPAVALAHFEKAQQLAPDDAQAALNGAAALHSLGRFDEAVAGYQKAMKLNPKDPAVWNNLAYCYAQQGVKLEDALDLATRATVAEPKSETFLDTLGYVYLRKKKPESAIPIFSKLGRANPNNAKYTTLLAQSYYDKGDVSRARQLVEEVVRKGVSNPEVEALRKALSSGN
jgi:tetratricopeptide (TPR) repeat protein